MARSELAGRRRLAGETAIITGGVGGIGRATAEVFAEEGANVAVLDVHEPESPDVLELAQTMHAAGRKFGYWRANVTEPGEVQVAVNEATKQFGSVEILANIAGMGMNPGPLEDISETDWEWVVALNLKGVYVVTRAVIRQMKQRRRGKIVNMSSQAGRSKSDLSNLPYAAAKAGVLGFTRQLASEVGPLGIRVNAIAPGVTMSNPRVLSRYRQLSAKRQEELIEAIPLRRFGRPEDIARVVLFLASDDSAYITGATIDVNGGRTMQ